MHCPACSSSSLNPVKLTQGLCARECRRCRGLLIDLLAYRSWAESKPLPSSTNKLPSSVDESSNALVCPKCSKLMLKFKISGEHQNRIDVCTNCDTAWLDQGEWELLGSLSMQLELSAIFTEPWQRRIREEEINASQQQRFEDILGQHDYKKLMDFKKWIESHPKKKELERILCIKQ